MLAMVAGPGGGAVLDGVLERVTFANPETGYTIARIAPERGAELITAVGPLLGAQIGEFLRLRGRWSSHPRYGRQFEVLSYATVLPATAAGIRKYLGSGLIKGIGPVMAERMVAHFGVDIMHVIEDEPGRLIEVDGLGPKRTAMIAAAWAEQKAIREVMIFLQGVGVSTSLAVRIYKKYGDASVSVVRHEPYRLAADVWGIGFKTADTIAAAVGIARDSPERIKAGLAYTLSEAAGDGHCYLPAPNLTADAAKILDVPPELIAPCLDELAAAEGGSARRCPHRRCPPGLRPYRRFQPFTCRPFIRPNGPWLTPCSACSLRVPTRVKLPSSSARCTSAEGRFRPRFGPPRPSHLQSLSRGTFQGGSDTGQEGLDHCGGDRPQKQAVQLSARHAERGTIGAGGRHGHALALLGVDPDVGVQRGKQPARHPGRLPAQAHGHHPSRWAGSVNQTSTSRDTPGVVPAGPTRIRYSTPPW